MPNEEIYLRAILATVARQTFPTQELSRLVSPPGAPGEWQIAAYNLCDGTRSQGEIAKELSIDSGNFSRTVGRWIDLGILLKVGENRETRLVHLYPLPLPTKKGKADA